MYWFNNLLTLATTTNEQPVSDTQFIWFVLGGLFLIVIFAVVVVVASTSSAAAAAAVDDEDSENM